MRKMSGCIIGLLIVGALVTACSDTTADTASDTQEPAVVEQGRGTDLSRVILSEKAVERLGIETAPVRAAEVTPKGSAVAQSRKIVPYAAVLYGLSGDAFVYTSPEPQKFVRAPVSIDYIQGDEAILLDGPPAGTAVVTVGAAELFGTEFVFEE